MANEARAFQIGELNANDLDYLILLARRLGGSSGGGGFITQIVKKSANYTVDTTNANLDTEIWCDSSGAPFNVTLPAVTISAPFTPQPRPAFWIYDVNGSFATNPVTVVRSGGGQTIDGIAASKVLNAAFGLYRVSCDGISAWVIKGS
jgi:hypothetical protein